MADAPWRTKMPSLIVPGAASGDLVFTMSNFQSACGKSATTGNAV
jgi:hypothetical protein